MHPSDASRTVKRILLLAMFPPLQVLHIGRTTLSPNRTLLKPVQQDSLLPTHTHRCVVAFTWKAASIHTEGPRPNASSHLVHKKKSRHPCTSQRPHLSPTSQAYTPLPAKVPRSGLPFPPCLVHTYRGIHIEASAHTKVPRVGLALNAEAARRGVGGDEGNAQLSSLTLCACRGGCGIVMPRRLSVLGKG